MYSGWDGPAGSLRLLPCTISCEVCGCQRRAFLWDWWFTLHPHFRERDTKWLLSGPEGEPKIVTANWKLRQRLNGKILFHAPGWIHFNLDIMSVSIGIVRWSNICIFNKIKIFFDITLQKYWWILISLSRTGICFTPKSKDLNKKLYSKTSKCIAVMWRKVFLVHLVACFCEILYKYIYTPYITTCICGFVVSGCQTSPHAQRLVGYVKRTQPLFSGSWATVYAPGVSFARCMMGCQIV